MLSIPWRRLGAPLKLSAAFVLAAGLATLVAASGDPIERAAQYGHAEALAHQEAARFGVATMGQAYLQAPQTKPTATIDNDNLRKLDEGLDPGSRDGALYPLRKAIEQLVGFLIWPIILIAILHALITSRGAADRSLINVGIAFFTVVFLLWAYPAWDLLIYRGIAIPISEVLTEKELVMNIVDAVGNNRPDVEGAPNLSSGLEDEATYSSPLEQLSNYYTRDAGCAMQLEAGGGDAQAAADCLGEDLPEVVQALHARSLEGYYPTDDESFNAFVAQLDPSVAEELATQLEQAKDDPNLWERVRNIGDKVDEVAAAITNPSEWLSKSLTGFLVGLQMFLASVILWFIWIGVIVARAFSLVLAPIAIVWGLIPNGGSTKAKAWFTGHARIALIPVGINLGLLIFYAMQVAIMTTPLASSMVIGAGIKFALFMMMITVMFKASTLSGIIAGDVTNVAQAFGSAARNQTIKLAGAVAAGGAAVATGGGSLAAGALKGKAGAVAGKALSGAPGKTMDSLASRLTGGKLPGKGLRERLGLAKDSEEGEFGRAASGGRLSRAAGAAWGAMRDTASVATRAAATSAKHGLSPASDPKSAAQVLRDNFAAPMKDAAEAIKATRGGSADERRAVTSDAAADALRNIPEEQRTRDDLLRRHGVTQRSLDPDELQAAMQSVDLSEIKMGGHTADEIRAGNIVGTAALDELVVAGVTLDVAAGPDGTFSLGEESASAIQNYIEENEGGELHSLLMEEAKRRFGGADNVPMAEGLHGEVLDVQALMGRSSPVANGLAAASQVQERLNQEAFLRSLAAHAAQAAEDSLAEAAARRMDSQAMVPQPGEELEDYERRMADATKQVMRAAWYNQASADDRRAMGLPADGGRRGAMQAMSTPDIDTRLENWHNSGSMSSASDSQVSALQSAAGLHRQLMDNMRARSIVANGRSIGLDVETLIRTGEHNYDAETGSVYDSVIHDNPALKANEAEAYREAARRAASSYADRLPSRRNDESVEAYMDRIAPDLAELVFLSPASLDSRG